MRLVVRLVVASNPSLAYLVGEPLGPRVLRLIQRHDHEILKWWPSVGIIPLLARVLERGRYTAKIQHYLVLLEILEHLGHVLLPLGYVVTIGPQGEDVGRIEVIPLYVVHYVVVEPCADLVVPQHRRDRLLPFGRPFLVIRHLRIVSHPLIVLCQQHRVPIYYRVQIDRDNVPRFQVGQIT